MWDRLLDLIKTVVTLSEELRQNREEINDIRQELRDLTAAVVRLQSDTANIKDRETNEREKLVLQLQNTLLRFERHIEGRILPPTKTDS